MSTTVAVFENEVSQNKKKNMKSVGEVNADTETAKGKMSLKIHEVEEKGGTMKDEVKKC